MNKLMVALVLVVASFSGAAAMADTLLIEHHSSQYSFEGTKFRFNEKDGTAWILVGLFENLGSSDVDNVPHEGQMIYVTTRTVAVEGLSYDAAAAQLIFTGKTGKVVCGTVTEKQGVFGTKQIISLTGACRTYLVRENRGESVYFEAK